jgi:uncharacterized protein YggU (UPF0235/DUF167 family)
MTEALPWTRVEGGLEIDVRLTPRGGSDRLDGIATLADGRVVLKARVRVVPEDGLANSALMALIADCAGLAPSRVAMIAGSHSRLEVLRCSGDQALIASALGASLSAPQHGRRVP